MRNYKILGAILLFAFNINAQEITITIGGIQNKISVSPYIYGKNNNEASKADFYKEAGLRFARLNNGNNATKYNWRKKISSHPNWYNNVYSNNWDATSQYYSDNCPDMQIMWAFQLLGRVASNTDYNFNDYEYNSSQWWQGVDQNLAGGGTPNETNPTGSALVEGDVSLYTEEWPADSTVALLNHWFGEDGLGLDKNQFVYWSMDNEPEIWDYTHDDVMPDGLIPASDFINKYIEVAKKARATFPEIKICGPVTANEWQWYKWGSENIRVDGKYYCWLEYFIKCCADVEKETGIRVLDVVDIHSYPEASSEAQALQFHRMYFDKEYAFPGASGVKTITGGWNSSLNKEYIFKRISDWLDLYYGVNHGIKLGLSEWGPSTDDPNVASVAYASLLGTFANNGVEYFMPWNWEIGMWETLHLFSRYSQKYAVSSISSNDNIVSVYTTVSENMDSMSLIIVNKDISASQTITVDLSNYIIPIGIYKTLQLADLPSSETFISHTENALKESEAEVIGNSFTITVPALSTTAAIIPIKGIVGIAEFNLSNIEIKAYPNPAKDRMNIKIGTNISEPIQINVFDYTGKQVISEAHCFTKGSSIIDIASLSPGVYFISLKNGKVDAKERFVVID